MKKILFILSIIASLVAVYYETIFMDAVSTYANRFGEVIRTAGMMFNMCSMLVVFGGCIVLVFYTWTKCVTKEESLS